MVLDSGHRRNADPDSIDNARQGRDPCAPKAGSAMAAVPGGRSLPPGPVTRSSDGAAWGRVATATRPRARQAPRRPP